MYKKDGGAHRKFSKKNLKKHQDPVLWARLEHFSPLKVTNSDLRSYLVSYFFTQQSSCALCTS